MLPRVVFLNVGGMGDCLQDKPLARAFMIHKYTKFPFLSAQLANPTTRACMNYGLGNEVEGVEAVGGLAYTIIILYTVRSC